MRETIAIALVITMIAAIGCAHHAPMTYRYVAQDSKGILIPPGVANANTPQATFRFRTTSAGRRAGCAVAADGITIKPRRGELRITVDREPLVQHTPGWLGNWAVSYEERGCLARGESTAFANSIAEALPLEPQAAAALLHVDPLHGGYVDLGPESRLKVVSPILRDGATPGASAIEKTTAAGNTLNVEVRTSADFLGYEIAWYALEPRLDGVGLRFAPKSAEVRIGGELQSEKKSRFDYFQFPADAAYFRVFFLTRISRADHDIDILAATTRAELIRRTRALEEDPASCARPDCVLVPKEVAVTPHIAVMVNGKEVAVPGGNVGAALTAAGIVDANSVMPALRVSRPYRDGLVEVEFDRGKPDILSLALRGGEHIDTK